MLAIFVRHPESTKNIGESFASATAAEPLTPAGHRASWEFCRELMSVLGSALTNGAVYSSGSARASQFAAIVGQVCGCPIVEDSRLNSIQAGRHAGRPEVAVEADDPAYFSALRLYRAGLLSSDRIPHRGESLADFEARVRDALSEAQASGARCVIVCGHRSTITASLIHYARLYHGYPRGFYGYVELPLLSISAVETAGSHPGIALVGEALARCKQRMVELSAE